ncbi:hypothetical protein LguiB_022501 [Lonicera macranthoides]
MISLVLSSPAPCAPLKSKAFTNGRCQSSSFAKPSSNNVRVRACLFNYPDEPIIKEVLKEPVAFLGGMFAGLLRLDLNEDPLKEWVTRTVEAAGITEEEIDSGDAGKTDESPEQIEIE